ncbi:glycosyltransferase involved in cell wall biosynthesis [Isoptericola jiangsuensis]|uniref:Glycosyltransferase involved in cell wall biosynthesis n=1 Tax=Isoptericola jiangsuensis TaxID=548579 RepID=A0A2A9F002_9MICO|nr:glycosyltransferase [Isoptericola jiangsuensis]PFG44323.1 glycosyltransferase involved in cell wall biosynthesis [Isoptericola jiangsuensis]
MILALGTYDAARHPRAGILVAGLRARGWTVTEVNHPLGFSTAARVRMLRQPWRLPLLALRLMACWALLVRDDLAHRRAHGAPGAVLVGYLGHFDVVLARLLHPRTPVVLDHLVFAADTALDRGARGLRVRLLRGLDRLALACADVVLVDTDEHAGMAAALDRRASLKVRPGGPMTDLQRRSTGREVVVVPVGAPDAWFVGSDGGAAARPLHVVFFGLFTPLQGAEVVARALADALPRAAATGTPVTATMIGSGQDHAAARAALAGTDGVTWVDWVEPADLPALVARADVCLGIFSATPKGLRVVPNKVFQGLAAGCVVVTSDTPPQRRLLAGHVELVPPADPAALADRLLDLTDPTVLAAARERARGAAHLVTSEAVVAPLVAALDARGIRP